MPPPSSATAATTTKKITQAPPISRKLFIASLGNPSPYQNTLHSAGHHLLHALRTHLAYPAFHPSRAHASGLISSGLDALLYQTPTLMNVSGPAISTAWRTFLKDLPTAEDRTAARLVVLHDELEAELGKIKVRPPGASAKGHNGLKSMVGSGCGGSDKGGGSRQGGFWRVGVGIGRPVSRESGAVAEYVLRKMTVVERERIVGAVDEVADVLVRLRDG